MRQYANLSHKQRKVAVFGDFRGIDVDSVPTSVSPSRAVRMRNFAYEDGMNRKRRGWEQVLQIYEGDSYPPINGVWQFDIAGKRLTIVYAGTSFYCVVGKKVYNVSRKAFTVSDTGVTTESSAYGAVFDRLTNTVPQAFQHGDRVYFVGIGDYVVLGTWKEGAYEFRAVYENEDTYIPTTTIGIGDEKVRKTNQTLDRINILTRYRKNQLIGRGLKEGETELVYQLDSPINADHPDLTVDVEYMTAGGGTAEKRLVFSEHGGYGMRKPIVGDVLGKNALVPSGGYWLYGAMEDQTVIETSNGFTFEIHSTDEYSREYNLCKSGNKIVTICRLGRGKFTMWLMTSDYYGDGYVPQEDLGTVTVINNTGYAGFFHARLPIKNQLVEVDGGDTQGSVDLEKGRLRLSFGAPTLVEGESNITVTFCAQTKDESEIVRNGKLGVLFGTGGAANRLFVCDGGHIDRYSAIEDFTYFGCIDYCSVGTNGVPIVGYQRLSDGTLAIFKADSTQDSNLYIRTGEDSEIADGEAVKALPLFLARGANIGRACAGASGILLNDVVFLANGGVFGLELAGNVASQERFIKERSRVISKLLANEDLTRAAFKVFGDRIYIAVGGRCYVAEGRFKFKTKSASDTFSYEWYVWDNMPVRVFFELDGELYFGTDDGRICKVRGADYRDTSYDVGLIGQFTVSGDAIAYAAGVQVSKADRIRIRQGDLAGNIYRPVEITENTFRLATEGEEIVPANTIGAYNANLPLLDVIRYRTVVAEWVTPVTDFGSNNMLKSIEALTLSVESGSKIRVGYETRDTAADVAETGLYGGIDFDRVNLTELDIPDFASTHTVRLFVRNFNYIALRIVSDENRDCAVRELGVVYKLSERSRGIK